MHAVICLLKALPLMIVPTTADSVEEANAIIKGQNQHSFLSNSPIFNPKAPLES